MQSETQTPCRKEAIEPRQGSALVRLALVVDSDEGSEVIY